MFPWLFSCIKNWVGCFVSLAFSSTDFFSQWWASLWFLQHRDFYLGTLFLLLLLFLQTSAALRISHGGFGSSKSRSHHYDFCTEDWVPRNISPSTTTDFCTEGWVLRNPARSIIRFLDGDLSFWSSPGKSAAFSRALLSFSHSHTAPLRKFGSLRTPPRQNLVQASGSLFVFPNSKDSLLTGSMLQTLVFSVVISIMCDINNSKDSLLTRFIPQTLLFSTVISNVLYLQHQGLSAYMFHSTNPLVQHCC